MSDEFPQIDRDELWARYQSDPIWTARGYAIECYALLEQCVFYLTVALAEMPPAVGAAFFYKIAAYRTRLDIMESLLKRKHGDLYSDFWRSLYSHLCTIDGIRNNVVHWHSQTWMNNHGDVQIRLSKGNIWDSDENTPFLTTESIIEFTARCRYFSSMCNILTFVVSPPPDADPKQLQAWQEICRQPITYPPTQVPPPRKPVRKREAPPPTSAG